MQQSIVGSEVSLYFYGVAPPRCPDKEMQPNLIERPIQSLVLSFKQSPVLEPVFCKKKQKKSSWPVTGLRDRGPLKDFNYSKLIVSMLVQVIPLIIQYQFYTIQNLQRSHIPQTSNWSGTFFAFSYSKLALMCPSTCQ